MNLLNLIDTTTNALASINNPTLAVSFLCMMFDHVCETYQLNKIETLETMNTLIMEVNKQLGNMYGKENQYEH